MTEVKESCPICDYPKFSLNTIWCKSHVDKVIKKGGYYNVIENVDLIDVQFEKDFEASCFKAKWTIIEYTWRLFEKTHSVEETIKDLDKVIDWANRLKEKIVSKQVIESKGQENA